MGEGDGDEDGSGGDEDGTGGTSSSRQGARTELLSPEFRLRSGGGTELFEVSCQYILSLLRGGYLWSKVELRIGYGGATPHLSAARFKSEPCRLVGLSRPHPNSD